MERRHDLEERLIDFASSVIDIAESLPKTLAGNHLGDQLIRSASACCLLYREAEDASSKNGFIQKMRSGLKELRQTANCLQLIKKKSWYDEKALANCLDENNQLVSIFEKCVE